MIVPNQFVDTTWSTSNQDWYMKKGYHFTKIKGSLTVSVCDLMPSSRITVDVICDYCGKVFQTKYLRYIKGLKVVKKSCCNDGQCKARKMHDCKIAKYKNDQYNDFVDMCHFYGYTPISTIEDYHGTRSYLLYECPYHGIQKTTVGNLRLHGCNQCGNTIISQKVKKSELDVVHIVESKNDCKVLNPEEYIGIQKKNLQIKCGICGEIFTTSLGSFKNGTGKCPNCSKEDMVKNKRITKDTVKDIIESKNNNILLNAEEYKSVHLNNLLIKCGSCGSIFRMSLGNYRQEWFSGKCKKCHDNSIGEKDIAKILDELKVSYTRQEHFNGDLRDKKPIPLDFYLSDYRIAIEFDGHGHYSPVWGNESFYRTVLHDGMKNNYCKWNNIRLIRIPYWCGSQTEEILRNALHIPQNQPN